MFRTASVEGSGPRTPPAYAPHPPHPPHPPYPPRFYPPRVRPPPPQYCFDAARFACDASKPRYLDVERERLVTRWLAEANEALVRRDRPPRYKPRSSERRPDYLERRPNSEWSDNFLLGRRNGSIELEDESSDVMTLKEFVDKFSLPRVVKIEGEDRPVLLYRVLEAHRRVEAVPLSGKKGKLVGKPLYIPDSYDGWFSACGCRGGALAAARGSVAALLRSQAFALVSPRAISAYRARPSSESGRVGAQYERAAARPGTPLRLAGVFADGSKAKAPKYAQLIDPQGNELFVPINTKGELYEVCPEELSPAEWEVVPGSAGGAPPGAAARAHRLPHLLSLWPLPARVRLLAGTVPIEMAHDVGEDLLLRAAITEPVLVMCSLPEGGPTSPSRPADVRHPAREALQLLPLHGNLRVRRTQLGFDTEKRMFLSARLQKALTFCQLNVDNWIRQISYANSTLSSKAKTAEDLIKDHEPVKFEKEKKFTLQGLKIDPSRLFGKSEKVLKDIPDETEGSIIFLSKNELEHMNYDVYSEDEGKDEKSEEKGDQEQFTNDKMHVFREDSAQKKSKWFKNLKLLKSTEKLDDKITAIENNEKHRDVKDPFDPLGEKHSSIERYQDMAKLIEDRFGASRKSDGTAEKSHSYKSLTTSSSEMGTSQCSSNHKKPVLTKSVSVQTGMPDSPSTEEDSGININHGRKNLSVDQINYCGSMESNSSSGRKLKSLDENMLKKSSASKSSTNLERRQRIQPDLIPEKAIAKSESYNQIQSCEDINMFGAGSMYNDNDFEINYKQHSFITEKLCSEFHVKTKRVLSKSTSNLLHPKKPNEKKEGSNSNSMPTKTERSNDGEKLVNFRKKIDKPRAPSPKPETEEDIALDIAEEPQRQVKIRRSISSIQKRKLPVIEDLPYGQVADAVDDEEEKIDSDTSSDNIYAEICTPNANKPTEEETYDIGVDVLATDPVICDVKKEVNIRNDERARQMIENQDNSFRHIEVVVIEKTTDFELDNSSLASSEFDDGGSKNDVSITVDSWEREKTSSHSDPKNHAIRLEITSNMEDYPIENQKHSIEINEVRLVKDNSLSFSNSIHLNGTYPNEAIYDTLK
ncbi:uncharacterized protein LOC106721218 [Papilio machaon]|uniref:uncharacterized protein LOC106721218 n=1 Tax=Papilio machaon TaxID=76193 RepID=UPI001E663449|nr:uncharacterized protein LOC106721218 [Papilio machaon]